MIHIRRAGAADAAAMASLLNEIIAIGGTTAYVASISDADLKAKMTTERSIWHLAEDDKGELKGFQWVTPENETPEIASIATFVRVGVTGLGVGSKLFEAMRTACISLGYTLIDAIIRADNEGGVAYYQSRGFEDYRVLRDQKLDDGTTVDKVWKRYKLP